MKAQPVKEDNMNPNEAQIYAGLNKDYITVHERNRISGGVQTLHFTPEGLRYTGMYTLPNVDQGKVRQLMLAVARETQTPVVADFHRGQRRHSMIVEPDGTCYDFGNAE